MASAIEKPTQTHRKKKVEFLSSRSEQNQTEATDRHRQTPLRAHPNTPKNRRFATGGSIIHPPLARGRSIISSSSFQDLGFGYLAPLFVGAADFWFPISWAPNPVPMVLSDAPDDFLPPGFESICPSSLFTVHRQQKSDGVSRLVSGTRH